MMKEMKRCFCNFSFYDQQAIQEKLEEMAESGWMLEKTGNFMWAYKRIATRTWMLFRLKQSRLCRSKISAGP